MLRRFQRSSASSFGFLRKSLSIIALTVLGMSLAQPAAAQRQRPQLKPARSMKAKPVIDAQAKETLLRLHNERRAARGVAPLEWSEELSSYAQEWADYLSTHGCSLKHRPSDGPYKQRHGENLYMGTIGFYEISDGVNDWYNELRLYDGSPISNANFHEVGHYTQMMWNGTTKLGAAVAYCNGNFILVCNYDPPGNVLGRYPYPPNNN